MGGRYRLCSGEMTWFWGASSSPQGSLLRWGLIQLILSLHTDAHKDVFSHMHAHTVYSYTGSPAYIKMLYGSRLLVVKRSGEGFKLLLL